MTFKVQKGQNHNELTLSKWNICFFGPILDDRGKDSSTFLRSKCEECVKVEYFPGEFAISFDGVKKDVDDIEDYLKIYQDKDIVLDGTTLGFVEILLLSKNLKTPRISFLYIEPMEYSKPKSKNILHKRDFELSGEIVGFKAIPGHSALLSDDVSHRVIFILGFESSRVEKAFEDHQIINKKGCDLIFGFPAFKPGWEMDSFANHIRMISEYNLRGEVKFGAATDPVATYNIVKKIYLSKDEGTQLFIAPLGTKPMAIGCALFLTENPNVAVLYDHPVKITGRSSRTSLWHLYEVDFDPA